MTPLEYEHKRMKRLHCYAYRHRNRAAGLCVTCGQPVVPNRSSCSNCLRKARERRMAKYQHKLGPRIKRTPRFVLDCLLVIAPRQDYYLAAEVAKAFGVSPQTIRMQCRRRKLGRMSKCERGARGVLIITQPEVVKLCEYVRVPTHNQ